MHTCRLIHHWLYRCRAIKQRSNDVPTYSARIPEPTQCRSFRSRLRHDYRHVRPSSGTVCGIRVLGQQQDGRLKPVINFCKKICKNI